MSFSALLLIMLVIAAIMGVAIASLEDRSTRKDEEQHPQQAMRTQQVVTRAVALAPIAELFFIGVLVLLEKNALSWLTPLLRWILLIGLIFSIDLGAVGGLLLALKRRNYIWLIVLAITVLITSLLFVTLMALATNPVG